MYIYQPSKSTESNERQSWCIGVYRVNCYLLMSKVMWFMDFYCHASFERTCNFPSKRKAHRNLVGPVFEKGGAERLCNSPKTKT